MKIAFNPSTVAALTTPPNNKDITFDLRGRNIFARGVKFCGRDTWRDIKINNVSIGSNILDLRNGSNTTLTNTNGVVTINSTWRPVVDNLTSDSTTSSLSANQGKVLKSLIDGKSNSGHTHDDRYYTKAESNAKYITDITTSVNKLTFTKNGSNIDKNIKVNVVYSLGNLTNISDKNAATKANSGLYIYNSYGLTIGTNSYSSVLSINTGGTIQIAGNWGDDLSRNLYWRSLSDRDVSSYPWKSWRTILDSENYSSTLDSRYYTESEVNSLLNTKLNRQNLSYGTWNPRGYNLAADYSYNGGDLSISESGGKIHISVDGYFWLNEGQYRVLDTSDVAGLKNNLTVHLYLSNMDTTWWPLIWGGSSHNNTSDSTGTVYKSYDKLSWLTSSLTLHATNIQTNNIKNLSIGGGIYWNPYVESTTDGSDAASITLVKSGVAGGTTLVLSLMNDANDTILFKTNGSARLYHNSYPILTTLNTYVSNNKGYINNTEITLVNNADTIDGWHKDNILWTGYITSPDSLSSYWFKMYDITVTGYLYNDITITFLISEGYSAHFSIFHLRIRLNGTGNGNYALDVTLRELVGNLRDKIVAYYNNSTGNVLLWGNTGGRWNTMNYTILKKTTRTDIDLSSIGTLTAQGFSSVQTPPSTGYTRVTIARVGSVSYSESTGSVHWNNVTNKPSTFAPAAHTHTVFKNNLMIKGTNGVSDSASIHLGIGDSDTGFKWISDGKCLIYANNVAVGEWTSGGMNWFKNPTVNGNKVWNAGNDGSGSGLDADTLDGYHETAFPRLVGIKGSTWNWNDVIRAGYYKIQSGTITNHPSGIYPFGMAEVITTENHNDGENRELQIYYPHSQTNNIAIWLRMHNSSTQGNGWGSWVGVPNTNGNISSATKLQTPRSIWGQSFDGTADVNGTIYINNSDSSNGAIRLNNNVNSNARISAISDQVIFNTGNAIRFGGTSWDWNVWAGLKYTHSNKTIYLGIADNSIFNANSALSGGSLRFPGISNIYATTFNGSLSGNASTATNADKVDGYHASSLWRSDGGIWNPSANISLTASGNNQEWSFDIRRNGYTGCYWHVWDSSLGAMLKVNADNGKVYAPYNFVGNLEGNASLATALTTSAGSATLPIYFSGGKPIACTASSIFSNLSNSGNNISVTVAGLNRTLTVGYASAASKINSRGNLTAYEEGSTTKGESGLNLYTVYNNGYPVTYGNLLHINGSGAGQLLTEWCGSSTLGHLYYRSKRDNSDNGWSAWGKVAFVTDNVASATNTYHLRINAADTWSTWYWVGLSGLPSWLWGSNDGTNMYVWNPSNFRVAYASSAGNADTVDGFHYNRFVYNITSGYNRNGPYYKKIASVSTANWTWASASLVLDIFSTGYGNGICYLGAVEVTCGHWNNTDHNPSVTCRWIIKVPNSRNNLIVAIKNLDTNTIDVFLLNDLWDCSITFNVIYNNGFSILNVSLTDGGFVNLPTASSTIIHYILSNPTYVGNSTSTTKVIVNLHTANDTNYPLVWSNLNNSNTVTENQLYKSWSDLYYNPKNKRLTVGGSIYAAHFYESSDKILKKNIKSILSSTNIPKIREFDWKDTEEHSYGFIALELEELGYGCLVSEVNGKKTVNYTATLALTVAKLLNLINIQNKKISNLTKELKALKYGRKKNS